MPGNFTPRSAQATVSTANVEVLAPTQEATAMQTSPQTEEGHGSFTLNTPTTPIQKMVAEEKTTPENVVIKKISIEDFKTPGYRNIATRVVLMPNIFESLKKNLDETKSEQELKFYGNSIAGQIEILENAQRTFKQIDISTEDEDAAKNLIATVDEYMRLFLDLDKKTKKIIVDGRARKVGAEICIPLKTETGEPNPKAEALIEQNMGKKMSEPSTPTTEELHTKTEESPSHIKYMHPDEDTIEGSPVEEKHTAQQEQEPTPETVIKTPISPITQTQEAQPATKQEVAAIEIPATKKAETVPSSLEPVGEEKEVDLSLVQINRLWPILRGKNWPKNMAFVAMMACVPFPQTPSAEIDFAQKTTAQETLPKNKLSPEDIKIISSFSPSLFGLSDAEYAAVCTKMEQEKITPYKILNDSSFVEFYIPTSNGNRDVRKDVSNLIMTIARIAEAGGITDSKPKEFGNETLEEYVGTRMKTLASLLKSS